MGSLDSCGPPDGGPAAPPSHGAWVTTKHKHRCCPCPKWADFVYSLYWSNGEVQTCARVFVQLSKSSQTHPIREKQRVDFGKFFI